MMILKLMMDIAKEHVIVKTKKNQFVVKMDKPIETPVKLFVKELVLMILSKDLVNVTVIIHKSQFVVTIKSHI